jgi:predicted Holliday junction resolvase-like endonuclease
MNLKKEAREIIRILESGGFCAECPCCGEPMPLKKAGLFYLDDFSPQALDLLRKEKSELKNREKDLKEQRKSISLKSEVGAKAVNIGFILERLAPAMSGFRFDRNDCRSLFDPIDYVIFEGLNKKGAVSRIIFSDIKTGTAKLKSNQKEIRDLVGRKKVDWDTYQAESSE